MKCNAIIVVACTIVSFANAQPMKSKWVSIPVAIDGSPSEWPQPFRFYDSNTKLQYAVSNDATNLYICFKVTDEEAQMKIFRAGINIWIDPKGKRKETMGINFPMKLERNPGEEPEKKQRQQEQGIRKVDINRLKQHVMLQQITLKIEGFSGVPDQVVPLQNSYGINAGFNWDSLNILCIEYKVPLAIVLKHSLTSADTIKPIGLGFVVNALETSGGHSGGGNESESMNERGMGGGMGGMNGGRGGMGGGMNGRGAGMGGGGMGGHGEGGGMGGSNYNSAAQEQKVWSKLILAVQ